MKNYLKGKIYILFMLFAPLTTPQTQANISVTDLQTEYRINPVGIGIKTPRFSWKLSGDKKIRGQKQTAWHIVVATLPEKLNPREADMWNSGKIYSDQSVFIPYAGKPLASHTTYYWKVCCRDQDGHSSGWSAAASWTTGILNANEWEASWIGSGSNEKGLPVFRKSFFLDKPVSQAIVSICGLGHYELFLNGRKVENRFLDPAWSKFEKTVYYNTFDISDYLKKGSNVVGVALGKGFYNTVGDRRNHQVINENELQLILQAKVIYKDGSQQSVLSDGSWKTTPGPILHDAILGGTDYDARRFPKGWTDVNYDESHWANARIKSGPGGELCASEFPEMRVMEVFKPVRIDEPEQGIFVYDFGQNTSAKPAVRISGKSGQVILLTPAEQRHGQTGRINNGKGRVNQAGVGQPNYWQYTLSGDTSETWTPAFNYSGFQYIEVSGAVPRGVDNPDGLPVIEEMESLHIRNTSPSVGRFYCSDSLFNQINRIIDQSVRSNMSHVYTDCPHREKLGWLEQSYLMGPSTAYGYNIAEFYSKIAKDIRDTQADNGMIYTIAPYPRPIRPGADDLRYTPEWGAAGVLVPWLVYQWYGDTMVLNENFLMMKRFVDFMQATSDSLIPKPGLGDWFDYGHGDKPGRPRFTPQKLTATAIFYHCADVTAKTARVLDDTIAFQHYTILATDIKEAFNDNFFNGKDEYLNFGSCQTANAMALALGLAPAEHSDKILLKLIEDIKQRGFQQTTGDIGHRYLLEALMRNGYSDVIATMTRRETQGSYGGIIKQGWTSMPEAWDINLSSSLNHCMLGHILQWFWQSLAGIRPDPNSPGFKTTLIAPDINGTVDAAKGTYNSMYGEITCAWRKEKKHVEMEIAIPVNTTALIYLPVDHPEKVYEHNIALPETGLEFSLENGKLVVSVGSGKYSFYLFL
jgi:hypothetical protein